VSKGTSFSPRKAAKAALGHNGFVGHTRALLESEAWRGRSIHLVRVLDRLELEHLAHAGKENGYLQVTYDDFVKYGISRRLIRPAIEEGIIRGLILITHQGGYSGDGRQDASMYQLTYLPSKFVPVTGPPQYLDPLNTWQKLTGKPKRKRRPFIWGKPAQTLTLNGSHGESNQVPLCEPIKFHCVNQSGSTE
jgi:hypothetical protein